MSRLCCLHDRQEEQPCLLRREGCAGFRHHERHRKQRFGERAAIPLGRGAQYRRDGGSDAGACAVGARAGDDAGFAWCVLQQRSAYVPDGGSGAGSRATALNGAPPLSYCRLSGIHGAVHCLLRPCRSLMIEIAQFPPIWVRSFGLCVKRQQSLVNCSNFQLQWILPSSSGHRILACPLVFHIQQRIDSEIYAAWSDHPT